MRLLTAALIAICLLAFSSNAQAQSKKSEVRGAALEMMELMHEVARLRREEKIEQAELDKALQMMLEAKVKGASDEEQTDAIRKSMKKIIEFIDRKQAADTQESDKSKASLEEELRIAAEKANAEALAIKEKAMIAREKALAAAEIAKLKQLQQQDLDLENEVAEIEELVKRLYEQAQAMPEVQEDLSRWAQDNAEKWQGWAEKFEKSMGKYGQEMEKLALEEITPWAEKFSQDMEAWAEKMESQDWNDEELAEMIEGKLEILSELPIQEMYKHFKHGYEDLEMDGFDNMDEIGDLVRDSIEDALKAVEQNIDKETIGQLEKLMSKQNIDHYQKMIGDLMKAEDMQHELQQKAAEQYKKAVEMARATALKNKERAEVQRQRAMEAQEKAQLELRQAQMQREQQQQAALEAALEAEKAVRAQAEQLLKEQQMLQKKNDEIDQLRDQIEALKRQMKKLKEDKKDDDHLLAA